MQCDSRNVKKFESQLFPSLMRTRGIRITITTAIQEIGSSIHDVFEQKTRLVACESVGFPDDEVMLLVHVS